jgi:small subunit ribosomal protein S18
VSPQRKPAGGRGGGGGRRGEYGRKYTPRRKVCTFCVDKIKYIDYKDVPRLRRHLSERGKIEPRRKTGTCASHQRALAVALKRARHVALLPYTAEHIRLSGMVLRSPEDRRQFDRGPRPPVAPVAAPASENGAAAGEEAAASGAPAEVAATEAPASEPIVEAVPTAESAPAETAPATEALAAGEPVAATPTSEE